MPEPATALSRDNVVAGSSTLLATASWLDRLTMRSKGAPQ